MGAAGREMERKRERRLRLGLERKNERGGNFSIHNAFFFNWFGSVRVNRFLHYKTENQTEPGFFLTILIGLIGFFFGSVFSVNFFSIFSVYSVFWFFCTPLLWSTMKWG